MGETQKENAAGSKTPQKYSKKIIRRQKIQKTERREKLWQQM